jgi:O-antigen ligase
MLAAPQSISPRAALGGAALLGALCGAAIALADWNALLLCAALIACAFIVRDFRVGVVLLVALMPVADSTLFPHAMLGITGLNPVNLLLAGTLAACLLQATRRRDERPFVPRPLLWLYLVPILVAGALGSRHVGEIPPFLLMYDKVQFDGPAGYLLELVAKPLLLVAFALLVAAAAAKSARPERLLVPALASAWLSALMVVVFVARSGVGIATLASSSSREFLSPLGLHANDLGRLLAVAYGLLLFTRAEVKGAALRLALLASIAVVVAALVLTFSRGAFVAFIVINALFLLWRFSMKTLLIALLVAAAALPLLPGAIFDRAETGFGHGLNAISAGRVDGLWLPLAPEVLDSPVYGHGLGSILWSRAMRADSDGIIFGVTTPHNAYLQTLLDMGIAGLVLIGAFFVHVWRGFRKLGADPAVHPLLRGFYDGAAASLAGFLVAGVAGSSLTPAAEQSLLWLAIGMMYGQRARRA